MDRQSVNTPLHTGIKAIDSMIPIGRGQRELIIGDRYTGKTTIAIDTILNQKSEPKESRPICIYVAIGQKESKTARLVQQLKRRARWSTRLLLTQARRHRQRSNIWHRLRALLSASTLWIKAATRSLFMTTFLNTPLHTASSRSFLRRPPGREAYPGDVFYLHSRLLERAAKLSKEKGGGSLTALPIIETQEGRHLGLHPNQRDLYHRRADLPRDRPL
jgi:F-type H+-transporting ATPase subunit alpha